MTSRSALIGLLMCGMVGMAGAQQPAPLKSDSLSIIPMPLKYPQLPSVRLLGYILAAMGAKVEYSHVPNVVLTGRWDDGRTFQIVALDNVPSFVCQTPKTGAEELCRTIAERYSQDMSAREGAKPNK